VIELEKNILIRKETEKDYKIVENLIRETFWNVYRPGAFEHFVLHCMRKDKNFLPELDFVMEIDGEIIGQNIFYPAEIISDNGEKIKILAMGPICISKIFQRQGYGKILLDYSLEQAKNFCGAVCFEGNINLTFAITICLQMSMIHFFFAKKLFQDTWTELAANIKRRKFIFVQKKILKNLTNLIQFFCQKKKKFYRDKYFLKNFSLPSSSKIKNSGRNFCRSFFIKIFRWCEKIICFRQSKKIF